MAERERLELEINADGMVTGRRVAVRELDEIKKASGETGQQLSLVDKVLAGLGTTSAALAPYLAAGAVALGGLAAAGVAAAAVLRQSVTDAAAAQQAQAQLAAGVASTGMAAGLTTNELIDLSSELQRLSGVEDDAIQKAEGVLLTFTKIGRETFPAATKATLDMAARLGTDLGSAAIQVGKALNAPIEGITALSRAGIQFTEQQKDQIKTLVEGGDVLGAQRIILAELETQFGGSAAAARNTFGGALDAARNAAGDLSEELGTGLLPGLRDLVEQLIAIAESDGATNMLAGLGAILGASVVSVGHFVRGIGVFVEELRAVEATLVQVNPLLAFFFAASGAGTVTEIADQLEAAGKAARFRAEIERNARDLLAQAFGKGSPAAGGAGGLGDEGKKLLEQMVKLGETRLAEWHRESEKAASAHAAELEKVQAAAGRVLDKLDPVAAANRRFSADAAALAQHYSGVAGGAELYADALEDLNRKREESLGITQKMIPLLKSEIGLLDLVKQRQFSGAELAAGAQGPLPPAEIHEIATETAEMTVTVKRDWQSMLDLAYGIGAAIGKWNVGLGETVSQVVQLADMLYQIAQQGSMSATQGAVAGLGVGVAVGGLGQSLGVWQGDRGTSQFGGRRSGDYGDSGAAIGGVIGGIVGSLVPVIGTWIGAAIGAVLGGLIGGAIKKGADEGLATLNLVAGRVATQITKDEGGLGSAVGDIGDAIGKAVEGIVTLIGGELQGMNTVFLKIRDDTVSVFVNGLVRRFEDVDEAIKFAVTEALKTATIGGLDPLFAAVLKGTTAESLEELEADLNVARTVLSFEIGEVGMAARDSAAELDLLRSEISRLVGDSDQLARSLAAINAEELSRWSDMRDSITGRQKTPKEELAERQRDAEIFNAEKALRIAELEFKQQSLIIQRDELQAEMQLRLADHEANRGWLEGKARFLEAEIGVNAGYATAMAGITSASIANLNAIIEANAKLIEGLKKIPDIDLKEIRISTGGFGGHVSRFGRAVDALKEKWDAAAQSLLDYLQQSATGADSPYTGREQVDITYGLLQQLYTRAQAGDVTAFSKLTDAFADFERVYQDYTGGGQGYLGNYREVSLYWRDLLSGLATGERPGRLRESNLIFDERFHKTAQDHLDNDRQARVESDRNMKRIEKREEETKTAVVAELRSVGAAITRAISSAPRYAA